MTDHYSPKTSATHVASVAPWLSAETFQEALTDVHDRGYVIIEDVLSPSDCDDYRQILEQFMAVSPAGRNVFEGTSSHRLYALLAKSDRFADMIEHPLALAFAEHFLGESCLLSACLSINLHPGETVQPWHTDDGHISVPQPHDVFGISVFWALDDTTETNGATEVLPYSHQWESPDIVGRLEDEHFEQRSALSEHPEAGIDRVKATMKAGSLMIMRSDVWHRGGANQTNEDRLIVTPQYCAGWARPLETMLLAVPPETVARLPSRTQALLGYSIHTPFMGYVDGMHPSRVLQ
jgi:ectoine hydroxylase-related dioxygenase (phytanoyl-CoA dioxygenase family)